MSNFVSDAVPFASARVGAAMCSSPRWTKATARSRATIRAWRWSTISPSTTRRWTNCARCSPASSGARSTAVLNLDNAETAALVASLPADRTVTYSLKKKSADLLASDIAPRAGRHFAFGARRAAARAADVKLRVPGRHNVSNALAALAAAMAVGVSLGRGGGGAERFRRRAAAAGNGGHGGRRHRDRRFRPQPGQDRRHPGDTARFSRPACS